MPANREENRQVALILTNTLGTSVVYPTGAVLTNATPMHVSVVDGSGTQITSFGGGTQYATGAVRGTSTGTLGMVDDGTNIRSAKGDTDGTAQNDITKIGGSTLTIGQQLAAASIPVILPSATITTLTPPAAITGFALEAGHLATIDTSTAKIPALGQALAAASVPVVLTAAQLTTLTPPTNTGYALDASLTTIDTDLKANITLHAGTNIIGKVTTDQTTHGTSDLVAADITKVGGTSFALGQQLAAASLPIVLTAAQLTTLTPVSAVTATLQTQTDTVMIGGVNIKEINAVTPLMGNGATGTGSIRVTPANDSTGIANWGHGATAASVPSGITYAGRRGTTALPTAVTDGQSVGSMADKFGRTVVLLGTIRDLIGTQTTTISSSTTETTIVTAAASVFNDILLILFSNTSATATRVDLRDTTAGSVLASAYVPAGDMRGFNVGGAIVPQTSVNTNWTAQCGTSIADLRVYVVFAKNK